MARPIRLQGLANELLQAIAAQCDATSALKLSATCCAFRDACFSVVTFKRIIRAAVAETSEPTTGGEPSTAPAPVHLDPLEECFDANQGIAARYAVALDKAIKFEEEEISEPVLAHMERYLTIIPHLRVFGYVPKNPNAKAIAIFKTFVEETRKLRGSLADIYGLIRDETVIGRIQDNTRRMTSDELMVRLTFCIAIEALNGECNSNPRSLRPNPSDPDEGITTRDLLMFGASYRQQLNGDTWSPARSQWVIAAMAHALHQLRGEPHPFYRPSILPPSATGFGFMDQTGKAKSPVPFVNSTDASIGPPIPQGRIWGEWLMSQSRLTLPPDTGSEWEGYYCMGFRMDNFDLPMTDVKMTVARVPGATEDIWSLRATGSDQVDSFVIEGTVDYEKGKIIASKAYEQRRIIWNWKGNLTPFGLVGSWHRPETGQACGYFWLWRKDWRA